MDLQYHSLFLLNFIYKTDDQRWLSVYMVQLSTIPDAVALALGIDLEYSFICSFVHSFN